MKKKVLIISPRYQENSGGVVALHKLCSILNKIGYESFLHPYFESYHLPKNDLKNSFLSFLDRRIKYSLRGYKTNPIFETPVLYSTKDINWDEWIIVYPETVVGNPLGAKHIVRWLLHNPGYHLGDFLYGPGELYFKFSSGISDFHFPGSLTSSMNLKVIHYPLEFYNTKNVSSQRSGTAYCIRKGKNKPIEHHLKDSYLIDDKSHKEVSEIFKKVKTFISYDTLTAYSVFAVLCGCQSVVIPDPGVTIDEWYPDPADRHGISYGFSNMEEAAATKHLVEPRVLKEHDEAIETVKVAFKEVDSYFKNSSV